MSPETVISCLKGQFIVGIKDGVVSCEYPRSQPHASYAIVFVVMTALVWMAILCAVAKLMDRRRNKSGSIGYNGADGGAGIFSLITVVTLLIMFGIYRLLNYAFGLDF